MQQSNKSWSQLLQEAKQKETKDHPPEPATFDQLFRIEILLNTSNLPIEKIWEIDTYFLNYDYQQAQQALQTLQQNQIPQTPKYGFCEKITALGEAVKISVQNPKA